MASHDSAIHLYVNVPFTGGRRAGDFGGGDSSYLLGIRTLYASETHFIIRCRSAARAVSVITARALVRIRYFTVVIVSRVRASERNYI